ncbi:hypothetical protein P255_01420 [Acinetobacter brisouii CIP 110357]|uniref:Uncharacterized protein n=1 Tax=Acinetobacter brisouii CIP 110357 TaxID=1341683 RepID=V2UQP5_9GAMM|nr:hypothetical protein [Acinetobacter brisouii]ENV46054.1 hypothetical protein F954_02880 [Acinetobacter brisouii ANC 4119]ESK50921.1 hypothetical protein P255_01420 [Acinetobacter brisouii CIP 110357]
MSIDASIPLMAQGIDGIKMLQDGSKLADQFIQNKADGELSRIYKESNGDLNKMLQIGQQSPMARWIMPQLQAQQAAQQQQMLNQQKTQSEIYKNMGSGGKDFADAGNTTQKTANSRLTDAKQAIFAGAQNGNPQFIRMGLDAAKAAGAIDDQTHAQFTQQLDSLGGDPAKISEWAKNAILAGSQNPASFLFQTADNAANNAQSDINNQRTTNASIYSTDKNAQTQQQKMSQDQQQFNAQMRFKQQQQYFEQNKPTAYGVDAQGRKYAVVNGKGVYIKDQNGNYITEQPKGKDATTQAEEKTRMARIDTLLPEIEKILPNATHSYLGKGLDLAGNVFGKSTQGQQASAQLKTLSGQLVSLMPKMSGPQSDKDVAMYKEMAGNLADDTLPIQTRMAALQSIRNLNNKYKAMAANQNQPQPQPQSQANTAKLNNILFGR